MDETVSLQEWADQLLRATDLASKLAPPGDSSDDPREFSLPDAPGRPNTLLFGNPRSDFPKRLDAPEDRAKALHFFANHELLAIELMALAMLRFRDAPPAWRRTLARVIQDEQRHFQLYRDRMNALGLDFGSVAVNATFWRTLAPIADRERFIAAMALTFEQANLDHCVHYEKAFAESGDQESAALMQQIHRDEIGHVAHGVAWANAGPDLWKWWTERLPEPLTPARAKGATFDRDGRKKAGFPADYIDTLDLYSHSRGRPPDVWVFHPHHEGALVGQRPTKLVDTLERDLGSLLLFQAKADDVVLVHRPPSAEHLRTLKAAGIPLPRFLSWEDVPDYRKVGRICAWGEDEQIAKRLKAWNLLAQQPCRPDPQRRTLASKITAFELLQSEFGDEDRLIPRHQRGRICRTPEEVDAAIEDVPYFLLKAPFSTAGRDRIRERTPAWIARILAEQGAILAQPLWDRALDVSIQAHVSEEKLHFDGLTRFHTDGTGRFVGVEVGHPWQGISSDLQRFCAGPWIETALRRSATAFAARAIPLGFSGAFGIDAMIVRSEGGCQLHPLLEVNARNTMSRIAWSMRRFLERRTPAHWRLFRRADLNGWGFASDAEFHEWMRAHPLVQHRGRWAGGALLTSEWTPETQVGTLLLVGDVRLPADCPPMDDRSP